MPWAVYATAAAAVITALGGTVVGFYGIRRQNRDQENAEAAARAQASADAIEVESKRRADAQEIGLTYMREAMNLQSETIRRLTSELGVIQGQLKACREESRQQTQQIVGLQREVAVLKGQA